MAWLRSPMYRWNSLYDRVLSTLHGEGYEDRFRSIVDALPRDAWILDVGCGTCHLANVLPSSMGYTGIDLNEHFLSAARERGLDARSHDVLDVASYPSGPTAIVVSDMLHHVVPHQGEFLANLGRHLRADLLICETITTGANPLQRVAGLLLDNDGINDFRARLRFHLFEEFTRETLTAQVLAAIPAPEPEITFWANPGRSRRGIQFFTLIAHFRAAAGS